MIHFYFYSKSAFVSSQGKIAWLEIAWFTVNESRKGLPPPHDSFISFIDTDQSVVDLCLPLQVIWSAAVGDPLSGLHAISL